MSRIGKKIIKIPLGVTITVDQSQISVQGPKGELKRALPAKVTISQAAGEASVKVAHPEIKAERSLWGTYASHLQSMILGVTKGFAKELEINGVGFKVSLQGKILLLNVGFSHPIEYQIADGIIVEVEKNIIRIKGIDKQRVGQVAAEIRNIKPVEPYKGKGIKYTDEVVRRKAGKVAKSAG